MSSSLRIFATVVDDLHRLLLQLTVFHDYTIFQLFNGVLLHHTVIA